MKAKDIKRLERNIEIFKQVLEQHTYVEIGRKFKLSASGARGAAREVLIALINRVVDKDLAHPFTLEKHRHAYLIPSEQPSLCALFGYKVPTLNGSSLTQSDLWAQKKFFLERAEAFAEELQQEKNK